MLSARTACFSLPPVWVGKALQLACAASREKEESERESSTTLAATAAANQLRLLSKFLLLALQLAPLNLVFLCEHVLALR